MDVNKQKKVLIQGLEKRNFFSNCDLSSSSEGRLLAVNDKYMALAWKDKGIIKLVDSNKPKNLSQEFSSFSCGTGNILDMEFSPFDNGLLAFSDDNNAVFLSRIQEKEEPNIEINSAAYLGHNRKVTFVNFNPVASNILCSSTSFGTVDIWESNQFKTYKSIKLESPTSLSWSPNGDLVGVSTKNKVFIAYDPRSNTTPYKLQISENNQNSKFAWIDNNIIATIGVNKNSEKNLSLLDLRKSKSNYYIDYSLSSIKIDNDNSITTPFVNPELKLIYTIAKEESIIRVFDYNNYFLMKNTEFKATEKNLFSVFLNRHCLDKKHNEIDRFARYTKNKKIYYVSFSFQPGKYINFTGEVYPSVKSAKPQMSHQEWMNNKKSEAIPIKIYQKRPVKEFHSNQPYNYDIDKKESSDNKKFNNLNKFINITNSKRTSKDNVINTQQQRKDSFKPIDYEAQFKKLEPDYKHLSADFKTLKEKESQYLNKINELEKQINSQNKKIDEYKQKEEKFSSNIINLKKEIQNYMNSSKEKENMITSLQTEVDSLKEKNKNILEDKNKKEGEYQLKLMELKENNNKYE